MIGNIKYGLKLALVFCTTMCLGELLAFDTYYWQDSGNHDLADAANWRLNGEVPQSFPPDLNTTITNSTQPLLRFKGKSELNLPNRDSLTLNWLGFLDANDECLIDLGNISKTLYLFGGRDACIWIGDNYPSGQKVTLKSGTIQRCDGATRRSNIRMGAVNTHRGALASFVADGEDARIVDMTANLDSGNVLFCLTNGATFLSAQKDAISIASSTSNAIFRVAGEGSLFAMTVGSQRAINLGGAFPSGTAVKYGGAIEVLDGGTVSNVLAVIGYKSGYHSALVDNGNWYAYGDNNNSSLNIGSNNTSSNNCVVVRNKSRFVRAQGASRASVYVGDGGSGNSLSVEDSVFEATTLYIGDDNTSDNNSVVVRNKSRFAPAQGASSASVYVGNCGHGNSLSVEDSVFEATSLRIGWKDGASGNSAVFSNATFLSSMVAHIGGETLVSDAVYATNNVMALIDCKVGTSEAPAVDICIGSGVYACSNRLELVRSEWHPAGASLAVGGASGSSSVTASNQFFNVLRLDDNSFVSYTNNNKYVYLGSRGCSNRLEVLNSSVFNASLLQIGESYASQLRPTSGNMVYVGKDALVRVSSRLRIYPKCAQIVVEDGTFRAENYIEWHYYYSKTQGKLVDNLNDVEADGVTFDTGIELKGAKPRFEFTNAGRDLSFNASVRIAFELPELPYPNAAIYGAKGVEFKRVANYSFDLSKVGKAGGKYVLAEAGDLLKITDEELARMNAALPSGRSARIYVSGNQLILRVRGTYGLRMIVK